MTRRKLAWLCAVGLSACVGELSEHPLELSELALGATAASVAISGNSGFADQRGGGIFVDAEGGAVRLRADGTQASLQSHPANREPPGTVRRVVPVSAESAWVVADNGVYEARSGFLYELRFGVSIAPDDLVDAAVSGDGSTFVALQGGLYRLEAGTLSELRSAGQPIAHVSALALAPAPDGSSALWFVQKDRVHYAKQVARTRFEISDADLSQPGVIALAGVSPAPNDLGSLWLLTANALFWHRAGRGFVSFDLPSPGVRLISAGRYVWLQTEQGVYRWDADQQHWAAPEDRDLQLLAADATGSVWTTSGLWSEPALPRVTGLAESARVYAPDVQLQARVLAADEPLSVTFALDDGEHVQRDVAHAQPAPGDAASLVFSLGGFDASGEQQSYSFAGLETGLHTLTITSQTATAATERRLHFDMQARAAEQLSWADDVQPVFMDRCAKCHTSGPGHTLDSYALWAADKAAIVAALVELRMPADGPLDPAQIRIIQRWAAGGAAP